MCGIAGEINLKNGVEYAKYHDTMLNAMVRRGPDDGGVYRTAEAVLLHRRLAVIDPLLGRQPMTAYHAGREYTICYNGELYNTAELRRELALMGERFETHSDTEVVLKAYIRLGVSAFEKINGIFALAIYDKRQSELLLARDKMGVKPLFYTMAGDSLVFASELKGLLCHPEVDAVIDEGSIAELVIMGPGRTPGCGVFKGIHELKAGHFAILNKNGLRQRRYYSLSDTVCEDTPSQATERVRYLVTDAIKRQLVSDLPIGTFLSGGLDSGIISAVASEEFKKQGRRLKTFSVTYRDNEKYFKSSRFQPDGDDEYIRLMADYLGSEHTSVVLDTKDVADALYAAVDARDLPGMADVDSSLLLFCQKIKQQVTVALSGECADEIFGGYPWYRDEKIRSRYGFPWAQSTAYRCGFLLPELSASISAAEYVAARYEATVAAAPKRQGLSSVDGRMREMVFLNMHWFMQTLLDRKDRMSMYSGLEVRVPFCDSRIVEYLYSLPWEIKDLQGREKGLLRAAMEGLLPKQVLWRKKSPYPKTHNPEYFLRVKGILADILKDPASPILSILRRDKLSELLNTDRSEPWYGQLMTTPQTVAYMIMLNYWMEKFRVKIL